MILQMTKAMIVGVSGTELTEDEIAYLREHRPWGVILFARNVESEEQLKELTASIRDALIRKYAPIFVDQEGGKVQRLRPPLAPNYPSAQQIGEIFSKNPEAGQRAAWLVARLMAFDLMKMGINANCAPTLDVPIMGAHDVIGSRAYSYNPVEVAVLAKAAADGLIAGGVLPVLKHMPGHGRALADTHLELAHVREPLNVLEKHDFVPFKEMSDMPVAMTAHIVFDSIDPERPATLSDTVINGIMRKIIGFNGLIMSDDISMKALSGNIGELAAAIIDAGCDIVLHCNGNMAEMLEVANNVPFLEGASKKRTDLAELFAREPDLSNENELREEYMQIFSSDTQTIS